MFIKTKIFAFAGKGGVGKTSLSAAFIRILSEKFPDKRILAVVAFAAIQAVYWLNLDNKIMFILYKIFNKITDKVPRDRRF